MPPYDQVPVGQPTPAVQPLPKVALEITRGRARHRRREVRSAAFLIGSAADCDLVLGDPRFDALHSYVFLSEEKVTIRHLGSGPPLCVGSQPVSASTLEDADRIQLGPYEFQVHIDWPTGVQRQPAPRAVLGQMSAMFDNDRALDRLLRDIESHSSSAPVRLFVGEDGAAVAPASSATARPATRGTPRRQAGL